MHLGKGSKAFVIRQYFHHIVSDGLLFSCSSLMLVLFVIDFGGLLAYRFQYTRRPPITFATTIVSTGLFATFVGVLIGLYGFDSTNITTSVPKLLEGLRFAFAGSVLGMGLSLILSTAHKLLGESTGEEGVLQSIDRKVGSLQDAIRAPGELVKQFNEMKVFLKDHLERINESLAVALQQLAKGATKEVTEALQKIITEFNQNLTTQFGDNFKELNKACYQLVTWQQNYRDHVDSMEQPLRQVMKALEQSTVAARDLTQSNEATQKVCHDVGALMKSYEIQVQTLEAHLKSCKALGEQAGNFLSSTQSAIAQSMDSLNKFSGIIESSVGKQSESLAQLTKDIDQQLPKALGELESVLTSITNQFAADYRSLFQFVTNK